jgi:hypothetical protein
LGEIGNMFKIVPNIPLICTNRAATDTSSGLPHNLTTGKIVNASALMTNGTHVLVNGNTLPGPRMFSVLSFTVPALPENYPNIDVSHLSPEAAATEIHRLNLIHTLHQAQARANRVESEMAEKRAAAEKKAKEAQEKAAAITRANNEKAELTAKANREKVAADVQAKQARNITLPPPTGVKPTRRPARTVKRGFASQPFQPHARADQGRHNGVYRSSA